MAKRNKTAKKSKKHKSDNRKKRSLVKKGELLLFAGDKKFIPELAKKK